jgi:potassium efflux system protein
MNRIIINVGIAYGSDTEMARELLLKTAQEHPNVLDDPPPVATFEGFGDNALNFTLRCFLPNLDNRLATITELHLAIDKAFRKAEITIAFPQRDVHLDPGHSLEVRVMPDQDHTSAEGPPKKRSKKSSGTEDS